MADQITISGDNLVVAANGQPIWPATTPPPNPEPTPTPGGTMKINNETDLAQAFAAAASGSRVVIDPSSPTGHRDLDHPGPGHQRELLLRRPGPPDRHQNPELAATCSSSPTASPASG